MMVSDEIAEVIVDAKAYADGQRVDEAFTRLRREAPLAQFQPEGYDPFWAVTRHADIQEIERRNDLFHNGLKPVVLTTIAALRKTQGAEGPGELRALVTMDNPEHFAYRRLTQSAFVPQSLRGLEARVREIARGFVDRMADHGGRCDFARDIALLYPLRVIMEILGVPEVDEARMLKLTQELFGSNDPDLNRSGQAVDELQAVEYSQKTMMDFMAYFSTMIEDRRRNPRDDLASTIANGLIDGELIGVLEAIGYYVIVATAGHDTTSSSTATGMWALAERPDQFRKLKADAALIPGHVDESIRWATPVKHFMRTAIADIELSGQKISAGDWLMLCYPSGNRDEAVFANPFDYDVARAPNRHLAFGYGAHVCLGQHLARMEMRVLWEELLPRLQAVDLAGTPSRMEANFVCGPKSVPIQFSMT